MKKLLLVLLAVPMMAMAQKTPQGVTYDAQIVRVSDGDTVVIAAPFLPAPLKPELAVPNLPSVKLCCMAGINLVAVSWVISF